VTENNEYKVETAMNEVRKKREKRGNNYYPEYYCIAPPLFTSPEPRLSLADHTESTYIAVIDLSPPMEIF
jgi:hypothetical protein